jgi:N6-L-threonylcarbamoyladenine synthase
MLKVILALESTCDETAAAIIGEDGSILGACVAGQEALHQRFEGVVPEIAARAHLESILPTIDQTLRKANIQVEQIAAIAVATQPGLPGSLLVGLCAAKGLCLAWDKPLVAVNHIHAHVYACGLDRSESIFPCIGFVVSGGHTHLYRCDAYDRWTLLGGTIDDAAGEAFDKVAVMLGFPFPGGPRLAKLADQGNERAFLLPRPLLDDPKRLEFSFSGLKTAVRYQLVGKGKQDFSSVLLDDQQRADMSASFQRAVIDCLVGKAIAAMKQTQLSRICIGGGVAANRRFRELLIQSVERIGGEAIFAAPELCTDNAVMGAMAWEKVRNQEFDGLDLDVTPGLVRAVSKLGC